MFFSFVVWRSFEKRRHSFQQYLCGSSHLELSVEQRHHLSSQFVHVPLHDVILGEGHTPPSVVEHLHFGEADARLVTPVGEELEVNFVRLARLCGWG